MPTQNKHYKQHTRRFRKSETAFINTLFRLLRRYRGKLTVATVARELHMSRQAFYLHHHDINTAITESEELLLTEFSEFLAARCPKNSGQRNNRQLITACFLFMSQRRIVFQEIGENMIHQHILYRMLEIVYPKLVIVCLPAGTPAPALGSERADLYLRYAVGVLSRWASASRCDIGSAERYIRLLLKLADEIGSRRYYSNPKN